jgi:DhnA family fructose-bisphosphate aldolase class Ia
MLGTELRMSRFFERGENAVIVAVDHGGAYGPVPGLTDVSESLKKLEAADALLMQNAAAARWIKSRLLESGGPYITKPLPRLIVRLNWSSNYVFPWKYSEGHSRQVISVKDAVAIGADAVLGSVFLHTGSEERDASSMATFGTFVEQKRELGMPLMAEIYPSLFMKEPSQIHEYISVTARIVAELGADMIKTIYTGERFSEIVKTTPIPILVLGGERTETEADALVLAHKAMNAGARGIVFGRNVFMARRPDVFLEAVKRIVKKGEDPASVAKEYCL